MAYVQNGLIEASDFNTFQSQIQDVYGVGFGDSGYGQTAITVPTVAGGSVELVKSVEWTALQNALEVCADHQGTAKTLLPPASVLEVGDVITAHDGITDPYDFPQMLSDISTNRLNVDAGSTSLFLNRHTDTFSNSWNDQAITEFQITFPTADDARYFFNSGGQVQICLSRSGGSATAQNTSWTDLLNAIGTIILDQTTTTSTGSGSGTSLGYYDLQEGVYQDVFTATVSSGAYSGNNVRVRAQVLDVNGTNGDNGRRVRFEVQLNDVFTGGSDLVDGDLEICVNERRATTYLTINSFVVGVILPLQGNTVITSIQIETTSLAQIGPFSSTTPNFTNQPLGASSGRSAIVAVSIQDEGATTIDSVVLDPGGLAVSLTKQTERYEASGATAKAGVAIFSGNIPDGLTGNATIEITHGDGVDTTVMSLIVVTGMQTITATDTSTGIQIGENTTVSTDTAVDGVSGGIIVGVVGIDNSGYTSMWGSQITKQAETDAGGNHFHAIGYDLLPTGRTAAVESVQMSGVDDDFVLGVATFR